MSEEQEIKKAKLVIIGNGFDLAHGYKTGYNHFICDLLNKKILEFKNDENSHSHGLKGEIGFSVVQINAEAAVNAKKQINRRSYAGERNNNNKTITNYNSRVEKKAIEMDILLKFTEKKSLQEIRDFLAEFSYIKPKFSELIQEVYKDANINNWVDVEEVYYRLLRKQLIEVESGDEDRRNEARKQIKALNKSLQYLQEKLESYLSDEITKVRVIDEMRLKFNIFQENNDYGEGVNPYDKVVILNFNYTNTVKNYTNRFRPSQFEVINIHGELNNSDNPIIFDVGDENHSLYKELEESNVDEFLVNVKSLKYLETSNYKNLRGNLDEYSDGVDVHMIGHSGGISDRTLLKEVFEHNNCKEINIHHPPSENDPDGKQTYRNISYGVSRYFENNMEMRRKVKSYDATLTIPQYQEPQVES